MPATGVNVKILVFGEQRVATKFSNMANALINTKPVMGQVANYIRASADKQFQSQGRSSGGSWKPLTTNWLKFKITHGFDPRILHKRGDHPLRASVTTGQGLRKGRNQILEVERYSLRFGSNLPYAATHQFGDSRRKIPARPFLIVGRKDAEAIRLLIREHIMKEWRGI